jgi:hypothetical protein
LAFNGISAAANTKTAVSRNNLIIMEKSFAAIILVTVTHATHNGNYCSACPEAFFVVEGGLGQRTPQGVTNVEAGHSMNGHPAGMTMEVFNSGR